MAATSFEQLPASALISILRGVPQGSRLQQCARISKAWAAAATHASTDVVFKARRGAPATAERVLALQAWLEKHSRQVLSLAVEFPARAFLSQPRDTLRLACGQLQQLQRLQLESVCLSLQPDSSSSSRASGLAVLPALRSASLKQCEFTASSLALLHSAPLTALKLKRSDLQPQQQLDDAPSVGSASEQVALREQQLAQAVAALLAQQPQLVKLRVQLSHSGSRAASAAYQAAMQLTALTSLVMKPGYGANLQNLRPAALSNLQLLGELELASFRLIPSGAISAQLQADSGARTAAGTAELTSALLCLTRLQSLRLYDVPLAAETEQQLEQFSALTASSQLSRLWLTAEDLQPLSRGALRHAFAPGRQLPQLADVVIRDRDVSAGGISIEDRDLDADADVWCIDTTDLAAMAAACSGLRYLELTNVLVTEPQHGPERGTSTMHTLMQLLLAQAQLTSLTLADLFGWLDDSTVSALTQLRGLRRLSIDGAPQLTDVGLDHLTQLTELVWLSVNWERSSPSAGSLSHPCGYEGFPCCLTMGCEFCGDDENFETMTFGYDGTDVEVWRQLVDRLSSSPLLAERRRQDLPRKVSELQGQLAEQAGRLAELEDYADEQADRVAGLERQLAAQADEMQQLRAGVVELRAAVRAGEQVDDGA